MKWRTAYESALGVKDTLAANWSIIVQTNIHDIDLSTAVAMSALNLGVAYVVTHA